MQELLRRLPAVAVLRAGGEEAELGPLLSAPVLDERLLKRATGGGDEEDEETTEALRPLRHAAALYAVMKSSALTTIGDDAFNGCSFLTSVTLPAGITSIGEFAFADCSALVVPAVPEGTELGGRAFEGCLPASW